MGMAQWFRRRAVARRQRRIIRNKRFHSFETAKTVGLIFALEGNALPEEVVATAKFLARKKVSCALVGYCNGEQLPEGLESTAQLTLFTKKELSWYGRPTAAGVKRFLRSGYDMVVDFCRAPTLYPTHYIASTVQASMIVGGRHYPRCPYDLIVHAEPGQLLAQLRHYLSVINHPHRAELQTKIKL